MNREDRDFLKELQHEMLTQDPVCQANPRFWAVMQKERVYGIEEGYGDSGCIVTHEYEEFADNVEDCIEWICDNYNKDDFDESEKELFEELIQCSNLEDFIDLANELIGGFQLVRYTEIDRIVPDTMFLTYRECEEHIKRNYYHYKKDARPYAMTAWRSPQVERLYNIIQNTNWEE
jgi:hypothetical protein|nr:MAG TPA: hypothetical protein [Caudoviricetes sp.]